MYIKSACYLFVLLLITIFGIVRYKRLTIPFKLVAAIIGITVILESISRVFAVVYHDSRPIYHITSLAELNFYFLIFYFLFSQKTIKKVVIFLIIFSIFFRSSTPSFCSLIKIPSLQTCYCRYRYVMLYYHY